VGLPFRPQAGQRVTLPLRHCGTPYQGINILLLWGEAMAKGYLSNRWTTYRQASGLGAQVRKGEHGSQASYANCIT
jgi:antirestriction protein ArdC